jgi:hypothetical protein
MKEQRKNLWDMQVDAVCITTNGYVNIRGEATMGAGCALEARAKFAGIAQELGALITAGGNHVYRLQTPRYGWYEGETGEQYETEVLSFPVKHHWREFADVTLIQRSAQELVELTNEWSFDSVAVPRPGCGNGKLTWEYVKPVIEPIFDDRFIIVSF